MVQGSSGEYLVGARSGLADRLAYDGQDIAEYAVVLAVILVLVIDTIDWLARTPNNAFSAVASSIQ